MIATQPQYILTIHTVHFVGGGVLINLTKFDVDRVWEDLSSRLKTYYYENYKYVIMHDQVRNSKQFTLFLA